MIDHELPRLFGLREAAALLNELSGCQVVSARTLRREVSSNRLKCRRLRPSANAKILVSERDLLDWLERARS